MLQPVNVLSKNAAVSIAVSCFFILVSYLIGALCDYDYITPHYKIQ